MLSLLLENVHAKRRVQQKFDLKCFIVRWKEEEEEEEETRVRVFG